jgi:hypothetical protein
MIKAARMHRVSIAKACATPRDRLGRLDVQVPQVVLGKSGNADAQFPANFCLMLKKNGADSLLVRERTALTMAAKLCEFFPAADGV